VVERGTDLNIVQTIFLTFYSRILITTDGWAYGNDVQQVSLVINYDFPEYAKSSYFILILIPPLATLKTISIVQDGSDARASR
jgi:hypothetical protein